MTDHDAAENMEKEKEVMVDVSGLTPPATPVGANGGGGGDDDDYDSAAANAMATHLVATTLDKYDTATAAVAAPTAMVGTSLAAGGGGDDLDGNDNKKDDDGDDDNSNNDSHHGEKRTHDDFATDTESTDDSTDGIGEGFRVCKLYEDGFFYTGTIISVEEARARAEARATEAAAASDNNSDDGSDDGSDKRSDKKIEFVHEKQPYSVSYNDDEDDVEELCWRVLFDYDGDEEDMSKDDLRKWEIPLDSKQPARSKNPPRVYSKMLTAKRKAAKHQKVASLTTTPERPANSVHAVTPTTNETAAGRPQRNQQGSQQEALATSMRKLLYNDLEEAKVHLLRAPGVSSEEEAVAALAQMEPPYELNIAMQLIHKSRGENDPLIPPEFDELLVRFAPYVGMKVRKQFDGEQHYGEVTTDARECSDATTGDVVMR